MSLSIEDYALIGDCHTAALVSRDGSVDWFCVPRFDSGACFAALLGSPEHGRWQIAPKDGILRTNRRYRPGSLILETQFETSDGIAQIVDFMPPRQKYPTIVRLIAGIRGEVSLRSEFVLRFDYGSIVPWVRKIPGGLLAVAGPDSMRLETPAPLRGEKFTTISDFSVKEGETVPFALSWHPSNESFKNEASANQLLERTEKWWKSWIDRCTYRGEWRENILRSMITLQALTYAPTGGVIAAPTTSLPEQSGGQRNWDYRYCWLRDATFTLYAMIVGGYRDEARQWRDWLMRAVAGEPSKIQTVYGVAGERRIPEWRISWLPGYRGATPVRAGNDAYRQMQLDVVGEVMDVLHTARRNGLPPDENAWAMQQKLLEWLEGAWRLPDEGIWEIQGSPRHFVHSKIMAWVAFDRAVKTLECEKYDGPADRWRQLRDEIHREICEKGFDAKRNSFVQYYGADHEDAALLCIPLVGFLPPEDPRMQGTLAAIERNLMREGFIERYPSRTEIDGLPAGEGTFLLCNFWYVDNLILQRRHEEARKFFKKLLALSNDVGLLSEQYDPASKRLMGNFPQAYSHVALINSARNLTNSGGPAETRKQS